MAAEDKTRAHKVSPISANPGNGCDGDSARSRSSIVMKRPKRGPGRADTLINRRSAAGHDCAGPVGTNIAHAKSHDVSGRVVSIAVAA